MVDPISFPVLAGAALTGAITFFYNRIEAVLDRRAGRIPANLPDKVEESTESLEIHHESLTEDHIKALERSVGMISVYRDHPELLHGDDEKLRKTLSEIRDILQLAYGRRFLFGNEQSEGPVLRVSMKSDEINGVQRGIRAKGVAGSANLNVEQTTKVIKPSGEMTGIEIDGSIG